MKNINFIVLAFLIFNYALLICQDTWLREYDPYDCSYTVLDIIECSDGGYAVNGEYTEGMDDPILGFVMKTDENGEFQWIENFEQSSLFWLQDMVETSDGGLITSGFRNVYQGSYVELIKLDNDGQREWELILDHFGLNSMIKTEDENIIVCGHYSNYENQESWPSIRKMNQQATEMWNQVYTFPNYEFGTFINVAQSSDGGFLILGELSKPASQFYESDLIVMKTNAEGDSLWTRIYCTDEIDDEGISIIELSNNDILVSGAIEYSSGLIWIIDENGNEISQNTPQEYYTSFIRTSDSNIVTLSGIGQDERYLKKYNNDFNNIWNQDITWGVNFSEKTICETADGFIVMACDLDNGMIGIAKLDSNGQITSTDDCIESINTFQLSNYPNPFNPTTTITFSIPSDGEVNISIFNVKGQKIKSLMDTYSDVGRFKIVWNGVDNKGKQVASGNYIAKCSLNGEEIATTKMTLLK